MPVWASTRSGSMPVGRRGAAQLGHQVQGGAPLAERGEAPGGPGGGRGPGVVAAVPALRRGRCRSARCRRRGAAACGARAGRAPGCGNGRTAQAAAESSAGVGIAGLAGQGCRAEPRTAPARARRLRSAVPSTAPAGDRVGEVVARIALLVVGAVAPGLGGDGAPAGPPPAPPRRPSRPRRPGRRAPRPACRRGGTAPPRRGRGRAGSARCAAPRPGSPPRRARSPPRRRRAARRRPSRPARPAMTAPLRRSVSARSTSSERAYIRRAHARRSDPSGRARASQRGSARTASGAPSERTLTTRALPYALDRPQLVAGGQVAHAAPNRTASPPRRAPRRWRGTPPTPPLHASRPCPNAISPIAAAVASLRPARLDFALPGEVAQLVEHTTENRGVVGSIPTLAILFSLQIVRFYVSRSA